MDAFSVLIVFLALSFFLICLVINITESKVYRETKQKLKDINNIVENSGWADICKYSPSDALVEIDKVIKR